MSALRLETGELLIVVSAQRTETAIADYGKRWGIETLFWLPEDAGLLSGIDASQGARALIADDSVAEYWLMLGVSSWGMAGRAETDCGQKAWAESQEYFSSWF